MKSATLGTAFSQPAVTEIADDGFWLDLGLETVFLAYDDFPWFRDASPATVKRVDRSTLRHLRWPMLDIDLDVESLRHPERYPLVGSHSTKRA